MTERIKNFLKGMGSAFDIGSSSIKNPLEGTTDAQRLAGDWKRVGDDIRKAINAEEKNINAKKQ